MNEEKTFLDNLPVISAENLIEYNVNLDSGDYELDGRRDKRFYRASSELLRPLIDEIRNNPNCSYVTPFNDLIKHNGYIPKHMSVVLKDSMFYDGMREVSASRIMNYFGVSTTYEQLVTMDKNDSRVMSVDFVSGGEEFCTFNELGIHLEGYLEYDVRTINERLNAIYRAKRLMNTCLIGSDEFEVQKRKLIENYIYSYIVRQFVLGDTDLHNQNFGMLINEDFSIKLAPNFDLEKSLLITRNITIPQFMENLKFFKLYCPREYMKFKDKISSLLEIDSTVNKLGCVNLINTALPNADGIDKDIQEYFYDSLNRTRNACNRLNKEVYLGRLSS